MNTNQQAMVVNAASGETSPRGGTAEGGATGAGAVAVAPGTVPQAIAIVKALDVFEIFPSPTNNTLMASVGSEDEVKCLFLLPVQSTFEILKFILMGLVGLLIVGIIVLTVEIADFADDYEIDLGGLWVVCVALLVAYLILKSLTLFRCIRLISVLNDQDSAGFHERGRLFYYTFGADVICSLIIAVTWDILFLSLCGNYDECKIFTDPDEIIPFFFIMTWFVALPFTIYIIFGLVLLFQLPTILKYFAFQQYTATNNMQWFLFHGSSKNTLEPGCQGCFGCKGCKCCCVDGNLCGVTSISVWNLTLGGIGLFYIGSVLNSILPIDVNDDGAEALIWLLVMILFWLVTITVLFIAAAISSFVFVGYKTGGAFHRYAKLAYLLNLSLAFTVFIVVFYGTLVAFAFGQAGAGLGWLIIGGFIAYLPMHAAQLVDAHCTMKNIEIGKVSNANAVPVAGQGQGQVVQMSATTGAV